MNVLPALVCAHLVPMQEEGVEFPGIVGRHLMGAGTQTWVLCKVIKHPNHCAFFPAFGIGLKNYFCILCAHFAYLNVCIMYVPGACGGQTSLDTLELAVHVNYHVGSGNRIRILCS